MRTVTGLFDTYEHAANAVHALKDAGIEVIIQRQRDQNYFWIERVD